jgi:hypothetical protein
MLSSCPFFKSPSSKMKKVPILEDEKTPRALVQILSPGGARGVYLVLPSVKKTPDAGFPRGWEIGKRSGKLKFLFKALKRSGILCFH